MNILKTIGASQPMQNWMPSFFMEELVPEVPEAREMRFDLQIFEKVTERNRLIFFYIERSIKNLSNIITFIRWLMRRNYFVLLFCTVSTIYATLTPEGGRGRGLQNWYVWLRKNPSMKWTGTKLKLICMTSKESQHEMDRNQICA